MSPYRPEILRIPTPVPRAVWYRRLIVARWRRVRERLQARATRHAKNAEQAAMKDAMRQLAEFVRDCMKEHADGHRGRHWGFWEPRP